jgi:hypothetical protein
MCCFAGKLLTNPRLLFESAFTHQLYFELQRNKIFANQPPFGKHREQING